MTEHRCPECNEPYKVGALFCGECGSRLFSDSLETFIGRSSGHTPPKLVATSRIETPVSEGMIVFLVLDSARRVEIPLEGEIQIGRADPNRGAQPHIDLTEDDGASLGVSRLHACLQSSKNGVMLVDLGSTNGTCLGEESLDPHEPSQVKNGDVLQLGQLQVQVFF